MLTEVELALKKIKDKVDESIKSVGEQADNAGEESKASKKLAEEVKSGLDEIQDEIKIMKGEVEDLQQKAVSHQSVPEAKSAGQIFTNSDVYASLKSNQRGSDQAFSIEKKNITTGSASAGALVSPSRDPEVYRDPNRPMRIRDLIPSLPVNSGAVEFMRQTLRASNAGPQNGEMTAKNQSNITWELVTTTCKTIAHWVPASRQVLSDAPQLQSLIDVDLNYGLDLEGDNQLLLGDGTAGNMTGLMVDAAIPTVGKIALGTALADVPAAMIDHIRSAVTKCQTNEYYNMTGVILNPTDWETLETAKATDGHYLMIQFPSKGADDVIWKIPVVVTNAMSVGNFLLGDFIMGSKVYDRESVEIRVSESHSDYFVKNGVAVLAEERYVLGIQRPNAFCKGEFAVATV